MKWVGIRHETDEYGGKYEEVVEITSSKNHNDVDVYDIDRYKRYKDGSRTRDACQGIFAYSLASAKRAAFQDEGFKSKDFEWVTYP